MKAEIITVGTEILLGDIVNTNSQYLAKGLADIGVDVYYQISVGDNEKRLLDVFKESLKRSDIIITTGGLGPTSDDITKEIACKCLDKKLVIHKPSLEKLENYFKRLDMSVSENNKKQIYFPKDAIIIENENGTAPGAILKEKEKMIIILPGPPKEMKPMFDNFVKPYLQKKTQSILVSKTLKIIGMGESLVEEKLIDIMKNQENPTVAPYVKDGEVTLRITAKSNNKENAMNLINPIVEKIEKRLGNFIYASDNESLEEVIAKMLIEKNMTISVAESCTGGMVSSTLINYPGISSVFLEGCVTYSNEAKIERLNVKKETLEKYGAVSKETANEMACSIASKFNTNIGLSTTGIAGPGGASKEKPVGLVYMGIYINGKTYTIKNIFNGDRETVRLRTTKTILNELRLKLLEL